MKPSQKISPWIPICIFSCVFLFSSSCNSYNFSQAQPADKENIYEFPKEFLGTWTETGDNADSSEMDADSSRTSNATVNAKQYQAQPDSFFSPTPAPGSLALEVHSKNEDSILYFIAPKYVLFVMHSKEIIVAGAWPKLDSKNHLLYPPRNSSSVKRIEYDSLRRPLDTADNYVLRNDDIYELDDGFLGKGYPFLLSGDYITVTKKDTICIELGHNAFLRKLDANLYVFNIRKLILGEDNYWWRVMILEKKRNQSFKIWECTSKSGNLPSMFYSKGSKSNIFYFDSKWTAEEMLGLMKEGYFEITSVVTKIDK